MSKVEFEKGLYEGHFIKFEDILNSEMTKLNILFLKRVYHEIKVHFNEINKKDDHYVEYIYSLCNECTFYMIDYITKAESATSMYSTLEIRNSVFYFTLLTVLKKILSIYSTSTAEFSNMPKAEAIHICNMLLHALDIDCKFVVDEFKEEDYEAYFKSYNVLNYDSEIAQYIIEVLKSYILYKEDNESDEALLKYILSNAK